MPSPVPPVSAPGLSCGHQCVTCLQFTSENTPAVDHTYAALLPEGEPLYQSTTKKTVENPCSPISTLDETLSLHEHGIDNDIDQHDKSYDPSTDDCHDVSMESACSDITGTGRDYVRERKFVVFKSCLDSLFNLLRCPSENCGAILVPEDTVKNDQQGMLLKCTFSCMNGHKFQWCSQPLIDKMSVGNLLSCASCFDVWSNVHPYFRIC